MGALTALHDLTLAAPPRLASDTRAVCHSPVSRALELIAFLLTAQLLCLQEERIVWLHLGVDSGAETFALEECAVNGWNFFLLSVSCFLIHRWLVSECAQKLRLDARTNAAGRPSSSPSYLSIPCKSACVMWSDLYLRSSF